MKDDILEIDPAKIKVMIHRERADAEFKDIRASIKELGQVQPGQVRDIRDWPAEKRKRPEGGLYDYELVTGEGRLRAATELRIKFRATVVDEPEIAIVGRFLAENIIRDPLPWFQRAKLVKADYDEGMPPAKIAKRYFISEHHAMRLLSIVSKTAAPVEKYVAAMPIGAAASLATLPADAQMIVVAELVEGKHQVTALVRKAKRVMEETGKPLSRMALKASLKLVAEDLRRLREDLKLNRLHHALGPGNLRDMAANYTLAMLCAQHGINLSKFDTK